MKNDLPYFQHDNDARNHAKMKALRARFGWTGYGQFWALNEMIAGAAEARLDLSRKVVRASVACELGMTTDALDDLLKFLSDPDECGLVHYENGILTTDRTQENYAHIKAERERKRGYGQTSAEDLDFSAENQDNSAEPPRKNSTKQSKGNEINNSSAAREGLPVDKSEEASLAAFALERAKKTQGVKNPGAYARKLQDEPDVIAAWREALRNPPPPPEPKLPPPGDCPTCGGQRWRYPGDTYDVCTCTRCGAKARWEADWKIWGPVDDHAHEFENSA